MDLPTFTNFRCAVCHTEIQASLDLVGETAECPACGAKIAIPPHADDGVVRHAADDLDPDAAQAMKSRTIRIQLDDL